MAKPGARSTSTPNVAGNAGSGAQQTSTHPDTRVIQPSARGQAGSVKAATVPVPSIADAESRRQKGQSPVVLVSLDTVGNATTESEQRHQPKPVPPAVAVPTKH